MLSEIKEHLVRHKLKDKLFTSKTNKKSHTLLSKAYKLRNRQKPIRKHSFTRNNTLQFTRPSPFVTRTFRNDRVPKASLIKLVSSRTRDSGEDSDEVFSEENASIRDKIKENVRLENITNGTESDSDSDEPITEDSDENENEGDSAPGHAHEVDRVADDEKKPDEDTEGKLAHQDKQETTLAPEDDINKDVEDEDEVSNTDEEDESKPSQDEDQPLHSSESSKKLGLGKNHKISPYEISDQMSQEMMRIYGANRDQTAAMIDRERHLEALNNLRAFTAQMKQEMLQRLRLGYRNTFAQNTALLPQFYVPQPLSVMGSIPEVPRRTPLILAPTAAIYHPATYVDPPRSTSLLPQSSDRGYSINVDGLHGVFSKTPGYVVRFHSPDSEVTVVKKENVVNPMTTTRELQIEAE